MTHCVHLDNASTAPLRPAVREAMTKFLEKDSFDPRRLYTSAMESRYEIENSRAQVAAFFGCLPSEVIFTSSSSESLAMIAYGVIPRELQTFRDDAGLAQRFNVVTTPYDSKIIHETWTRENVDLRVIAGNTFATLELPQLSDMVDENTLGVSLPLAHPDTGTLQDIDAARDLIRDKNPQTLIHVDARSASGYKEINFAELDVDAFSVDAVTFGGPSGVAALILCSGLLLSPLLTGSTQERGRRGGLENGIGIAGFGALCEDTSLETEIPAMKNFQQGIVNALSEKGAVLVPEKGDSLPHIVSAFFPGVAASVVVAEFNRSNINIHAGSSCGSEEFEPSSELSPVTQNDDISECVFRVSVGWATTQEDIATFVETLKTMNVTR